MLAQPPKPVLVPADRYRQHVHRRFLLTVRRILRSFRWLLTVFIDILRSSLTKRNQPQSYKIARNQNVVLIRASRGIAALAVPIAL
jgi:hypothetical protein